MYVVAHKEQGLNFLLKYYILSPILPNLMPLKYHASFNLMGVSCGGCTSEVSPTQFDNYLFMLIFLSTPKKPSVSRKLAATVPTLEIPSTPTRLRVHYYYFLLFSRTFTVRSSLRAQNPKVHCCLAGLVLNKRRSFLDFPRPIYTFVTPYDKSQEDSTSLVEIGIELMVRNISLKYFSKFGGILSLKS